MTAATTSRTKSPSLSRRLLGSGLLDALTAPHGVDRYLELLRPTWSLSEPRAEITAVRRRGGSVTLGLRPNAAWAGFRAGQFVRVAVEIDGVLESRCYSPAGSEYDDRSLELTVKAHQHGRVSRHLFEHARPGLTLGLSAAEGDFVLPAKRPERLLLISGGSGITPVMSMLRTLSAEGHRGAVTFLHYAARPDDAAYLDELERIAAHTPNVVVAHSYTRERDASALRGHICREHLELVAPDYADAQTYVCGPPALIAWTRERWARESIDDRLHIESFLPPTIAPAGDPAEGTITFAGSGISVANDGQPLLVAAEHAGLSPAFGCRMGICHTCTTCKAAGVVRDARSGEISSPEREDIQICVSVPLGDVQVDL
jgi:ferredoxin-NADP reductase